MSGKHCQPTGRNYWTVCVGTTPVIYRRRLSTVVLNHTLRISWVRTSTWHAKLADFELDLNQADQRSCGNLPIVMNIVFRSCPVNITSNPPPKISPPGPLRSCATMVTEHTQRAMGKNFVTSSRRTTLIFFTFTSDVQKGGSGRMAH